MKINISERTWQIILAIAILLISLIIYLHFSSPQMTSNSLLSNSNQQLYYTRPTGCNQAMTAQEVYNIANTTGFLTREDCLTYTNPQGYLSIVGS